MFLLTKPSGGQIQRFIASLADSPYSYANVGATGSAPPPHYVIDHNRVRLGSGPDAWSLSVEAINSWQMFKLGWVQLFWPDVAIRSASEVAVLVRHYGFYSLNGARIVYVIDDDGPVKRYGFAYGTLQNHAESGEERFLVEWNREDDSVHYDILAFSRPAHLLSRIAFPLSRVLQKRFASDSKAAMLAFVRGGID